MTHSSPSSVLGLRRSVCTAAVLLMCAGTHAQVASAESLRESELGPPPTSVGGPPLPQAQPQTVVPVEPAKPESAVKPEEAVKSEDDEDFNLGRFHMTFGFDITTAYFFRGIKQERSGVNVQPYATIAVDLIEWDGGGITGDLTTWHSFATDETNASDSSQGLVRSWYEADLGGGMTVKQDALALRLGYNIATSPNDGADEVQEIILGLNVDDSSWMDAWALNPAMTIAFEVSEDGGDGTGSGGGVYMELGITPGFNIDVGPAQDIRVNFPTLLGLSLSGFYQDSAGHDNTFGFFESGVRFLIPLPLPKAFGKWTLTSGVRFLYLGDTTSAFNVNGDECQVIGTFGLNLSF